MNYINILSAQAGYYEALGLLHKSQGRQASIDGHVEVSRRQAMAADMALGVAEAIRKEIPNGETVQG